MADNSVKRRTDYTEGSIIGSILKMGLPSMFGFLSQNIYSLVDTYWVSRLEQEEAAVAGVTFFATILWMFFSFNQLVGPGSVAVISRRYGEKKYDEAETAIKETLVLKLFFGFIFGVVGYFTVGSMLRGLGAEGDALLLGAAYGRIMFLGMGISYACFSIFTAMRGVANPGMAMFLMIGSNLLNVILDPLLIFGHFGFPALGIKGAAIASVASYTITFVVGMSLFFGGQTNISFRLAGEIPIRIKSMWKLMKIGIPSWAGSMSYTGARLIVTKLVAIFGTSVVAAFGVANQITSFGVMILVGIGLGLSSLIGHNVGSGKLERAKQTADHSILLGVGVMLFFGAVVALFSSSLIGFFFENPETIKIGSTMLKILSLAFPFWGAYLMMENVFSGVGMNMPAMVADIVVAWLFQVIPIIILTKVFDYSEIAVWWTMSLSYVIVVSGFYFYYRKDVWLTAKV